MSEQVPQSVTEITDYVEALAARVIDGDYGPYRLERTWTNRDNGTIHYELRARQMDAPFARVEFIAGLGGKEQSKIFGYSIEGHR